MPELESSWIGTVMRLLCFRVEMRKVSWLTGRGGGGAMDISAGEARMSSWGWL